MEAAGSLCTALHRLPDVLTGNTETISRRWTIKRNLTTPQAQRKCVYVRSELRYWTLYICYRESQKHCRRHSNVDAIQRGRGQATLLWRAPHGHYRANLKQPARAKTNQNFIQEEAECCLNSGNASQQSVCNLSSSSWLPTNKNVKPYKTTILAVFCMGVKPDLLSKRKNLRGEYSTIGCRESYWDLRDGWPEGNCTRRSFTNCTCHQILYRWSNE